jgi:peptide chain release factor subunit 1
VLQEVDDKIVKELASIYDDYDTFISLYLDVTHGIDWKFIERRQRQIESVFKTRKELLKTFQKNMLKLEPILKQDVPNDIARNKYHGVAIFISEKLGYLKAIGLPRAVDNTMIVDTSPYIRHLAQLLDDWEEYAMVLIDNHQASLFVITMGAIKDKAKLATHIINKHKKGGWSQMRFSRLRKEAIDKFQKKVVEALEKFIEDDDIVGIILAGPGGAKDQFKKELPHRLNQLVIGEYDYDMDIPLEKLVEATSEEVWKREQAESNEAVIRLKNEILKGGRAVFGITETVNASREGKVELLILSEKFKPRGWICEHCQVVEVGTKARCPYCDHITSEVDVLEEILEFAERSGSNIEFVGDNPILDELGGVGALLRY